MGRDMPETRHRKILTKNLDYSKIVVIFPHIGFLKNGLTSNIQADHKVLSKVY